MAQAIAKLKNLNIAPRKVRLICDVLRGKHVYAALAQLKLVNLRASGPVEKLLKSAISNAKNKSMDPGKLFVKSIIVNQGPMLKRYLPRARGSATEIQKKFSHVLIILEESDKVSRPRYVIVDKTKKKKAEKVKPVKTKKTEEVDEKIGTEKKGFMKKIFNRKSV